MNDKLLAVAFDLDGTIVNSEDLHEMAGEEVLRRRGKTYDHALREQVIGRPAVDSLRLMIDYHALDDPLEDLLRECAEATMRLIETSIAAMPGVLELVSDLRRAEIRCGICTSSTRDYADFVLTRLDIKQHFQFINTAEDVTRGKPAPEVYQLAATKFGIEPRQMLVLEDSANGCRSGVAAGAFTVAVPNHHTRLHNFDGARFIALSLADPRIREALAIL